jgi:hypothetical protein
MAYFARPVAVSRQSSYLTARSPSPTLEHYDEASNLEARFVAAVRSLPCDGTMSALHAASADLRSAIRSKPHVHIFDPLLAILQKMASAEEVECERQKGMQIVERCNWPMRDARVLSREMAEKKQVLVVLEKMGSEVVWLKLIEQAKAATVAVGRA